MALLVKLSERALPEVPHPYKRRKIV